jgi:hypothetical protein
MVGKGLGIHLLAAYILSQEKIVGIALANNAHPAFAILAGGIGPGCAIELECIGGVVG